MLTPHVDFRIYICSNRTAVSEKKKSLVSSNCTIDFWEALEIVFVYRHLKHDNAGADKTKH